MESGKSRTTSLAVFPTAEAAWRSLLRDIDEDGSWCDSVRDVTSIGSQFGQKTRRFKELMAHRCEIENPRARVISSPARAVNQAFAVANTVWAFSGSNRVEDILPYNARGACFSADGQTYACAIGQRVFSDQHNQYGAISDRLRQDLSSRRACIVTLTPSDVVNAPLDTPCTIALQFLLRDGLLHCITYMRSQSALYVWPYDIYLFTMIQERLSLDLGVGLGRYVHICGSLHVYEDEWSLFQMCRDEVVSDTIQEMEHMEVPTGGWAALLEEEECIRAACEGGQRESSARRNLGAYWNSRLNLVESTLRASAR